MRHRGQLSKNDISEEQFGVWLIQGGIAAITFGILAFFRVPLMTALNSLF